MKLSKAKAKKQKSKKAKKQKAKENEFDFRVERRIYLSEKSAPDWENDISLHIIIYIYYLSIHF